MELNPNGMGEGVPHWEDAYRIKSDGHLYYGDIASEPNEADAEVGDWFAFATTDDSGVRSMTLMAPDFYADMVQCESLVAEKCRWDGCIGGPEDLRYARDLKSRFMDIGSRVSLYTHRGPERYDLTTGVFHVSEGRDFDARSLAIGPRTGFVQDGSFVGTFVSAMARRPHVDVSTYTNDITDEICCIQFTTDGR